MKAVEHFSPDTLPLNGVRVIEFCEVAAGPFCGMLLADMGADVIKVERPVMGDSMRSWPPQRNGYGETFAALNRNKRSVVLDLRDESQLHQARALIWETADVVIQNYRPGVMSKYGLDFESLKKEKENLIYCSMSAFGQTGPRASEGGYDLTMQAIAGVMSVTGEAGHDSVKSGAPVSDFSTAFYAAFSIVSFLYAARKSGQGAHIDISMLGATLGFSVLQLSELFGNGVDPKKHGSAHPRNAPYRAFRASDGEFVIAAGNDRLWQRVCEAMRRKDLLEDQRFSSTSSRAAHQGALFDLLSKDFREQSVSYWVDLFTAYGVPVGPINSYSAAIADPQVGYLELITEMELPPGGNTRTLLPPFHVNGKLLPVRRRPPALGEHTAEILEDIGRHGNTGIRVSRSVR